MRRTSSLQRQISQLTRSLKGHNVESAAAVPEVGAAPQLQQQICQHHETLPKLPEPPHGSTTTAAHAQLCGYAAATAALLASAASFAACEASHDQEAQDVCGAAGAEDASANADTLSEDALAAKSVLAKMWIGVDQALSREEATCPRSTLTRRKVPQIGMFRGQTSVIIPVRAGVDIRMAMPDIAAAATVAVALQDEREGRAVLKATGKLHFEMSDDGWELCGISGAPLPKDRLQVQVRTTAGTGRQPVVQFLKTGRLTDDDVAVIGKAMHHANHHPFLSTSAQGVPENLMHELLQFGLDAFPGSRTFLSQLGDAASEFQHCLDSMQQFSDEDATGEGQLLPLPPPPAHWQSSPDSAADISTQAPKQQWGSRAAAEAVAKLQGMGCSVHHPGNPEFGDWGLLQGYEEQKQQIEDGLLLPLRHPEVFDEVTKATRRLPGSSRPRAVLFEGPPGTGKTTAARVIATQAAVPLVYVPLEALGSKWYGASEKLLASVFAAAQQLDGAIVFFDEIDSLATSRSGDMHEATRKLLGVLLREMDGFDAKKSIVIGATNRSSDLDPALLSRFDTFVSWPLPDEGCRAAIMHSYAQQLSDADVARLAVATPGASGRDLRDIASRTERAWGARIAKGDVQAGKLPPVDAYLKAAEAQQQKAQAATSHSTAPRFGLQSILHGPRAMTP